MELLPIRRALISVTDKSGLENFAPFLASHNVTIISTGGTLAYLRSLNVPVTSVEEVTGFPEIMGGRVKTLHPLIHAGILADKDKPEHRQSLTHIGATPIDLVCVNLYNFAEAAQNNLPLAQAIEQIDIGGPCMIRAAAKNYHSVLVAPAASCYTDITQALQTHQMQAPLALRQKMALTAFAATAAYDAMITSYFAGKQ